MDYRTASRSFDLASEISKLKGMKRVEILISLEKASSAAKKVPVGNKAVDREAISLQVRYLRELGHLSYLFKQLKRPAGITEDLLEQIKPLVDDLIGNGEISCIS